MRFGENLALARKRKGQSQESLAEELGVSRQSIYTWEAGIASPSIEMASSLAKSLGVSLSELAEGRLVDLLPRQMAEYSLTRTRLSPKSIRVEELAGWLIAPKEGEEVAWAVYGGKKGERESAYHVWVRGLAKIHEQEGVEISIEEYGANGILLPEKEKTFYAQIREGKTRYLALETHEGGFRHFEDYRDSSFRKFWGESEATAVQSTGSYDFAMLGKSLSLERLPLYPEGDFLIDQYVDEAGQTILWKRYAKTIVGKDSLDYSGTNYGLDYQILTSRFFLK
jgi:transcriptional regulator with XRE-family HTH domain